MNKQDWIKLIFDILATLLSSIAILIYVIQTRLQKKSINNDFERSRREKAIESLRHWFSKLDKTNSTARKLMESLTEDNLLSIWHCESFSMAATPTNKKYFEVLFNYEKGNPPDNEKSEIFVSAQQATEIRWQAISYLNALENVVAAWKYNIVDRDLIEAEFKYMFDHKGGALKKFREIMVDAYPCIDLFELEMQDKYKAKISKDYEKLGK